MLPSKKTPNGGMEDVLDIVEPILKSVESTGGGWPVLVLVIVIGVITYLVSRWMDRQAKVTEQRMSDRKGEFEAELERERMNAESHKDVAASVIGVVRQNTQAMTEFSNSQRELTSVLRPMVETLSRIDRHFEETGFQSRRKGEL